MITKILKILSLGFVFATIVFLTLVAIKGKKGDPIAYQSELTAEVGGPFENSGSTSRYALIQSIVDNNSLEFTLEQAYFASPDVVHFNDKYFTIFTPGVSFVLAPFYLLGKEIGYPQLVTFLANTLFAIFNLGLVYLISRRLGAQRPASLIAGIVFLFGTNAIVYAQTTTQHHISTFLLLLAVLNANIVKRNLLNNLSFGLIVGAAFLMDFPNPLMLIPVGIFVLVSHFKSESNKKGIELRINPTFVAIVVGLLPFMLAYGVYNQKLTGSYTLIGQFLGRSAFGEQKYDATPPSASDLLIKSSSPIVIKTPFQTRKQIQGVYILLMSDERSWIFYSPIVLLGAIGLYLSFKNDSTKTLAMLCVSVILFDFLVYSIFGDPWGGWGFGPRYLIPAAAFMSAGLGLALDKFRKNVLFVPLFFVLCAYSFYISLLGANTTQSVPPKVEAVALATPISHTYMRNQTLLNEGKFSSLVYSLWLEDVIRPQTLLIVMTGMATTSVVILYFYVVLHKTKKP